MAVVIETTMGDITVDLFVEERPSTCKNFLKLCKIKYYNFCLFHDVQRNFIAQTGDPSGTGRGGESIFCRLYGDQAKYIQWETKPRLKHRKRGLISMVNNGENMHGSQFFFTLSDDLDTLDGVHTVFGEVSEGYEVLEQVNEILVDEEHRPYKDIRITHTVILEDPFEDPPNMVIPERSPEVTDDIIKNSRLLEDEDTEGKTAQDLAEEEAEKEARARATVLEMIGDLPSVDVAPPENVLFVCKLNPVTTDEDLEIIFSRFGEIVSCEVVKDKKTGNSLQYAFIEFKEAKSCEDAYFKMDNVLIDDRRIHVDFSQSVAKYKEWTNLKRGKMDRAANGKQERKSRSPRRKVDSRESSSHSRSSKRTESGEIRTPRRGDESRKGSESGSRSTSRHTERGKAHMNDRLSTQGSRNLSSRRRSRSRSDSRSTRRRSVPRSGTRDSRSRSRSTSRGRGGRPMPGVDSFYRKNRERWNQPQQQRNFNGQRGGYRGWNRGYQNNNGYNNRNNYSNYRQNNNFGNTAGFHNQRGNAYRNNYQNGSFRNNQNNWRTNGYSNNGHQRFGYNNQTNTGGPPNNWNSWRPQQQNQAPQYQNAPMRNQYNQPQAYPNQYNSQHQAAQMAYHVKRWHNSAVNAGQWNHNHNARALGYNSGGNNDAYSRCGTESGRKEGRTGGRKETSSSHSRRDKPRSRSRSRDRRRSPAPEGERRRKEARTERTETNERAASRSPSRSSAGKEEQTPSNRRGSDRSEVGKEEVKALESDKTRKRRKGDSSSSSESAESDSDSSSSSSSEEERKKRKKSKKTKKSKHRKASKSKSRRRS